MRKILSRTGIVLFFFIIQQPILAQKRLYIANDDHTDFMWTRDSSQYVNGFVQMLDRWMYVNDSTKAAHPGNYNLQSKWNCDGAYWVSYYEKVKGSQSPGFDSLIRQIKDGQITVPYSPLVIAYGGVPVEGVIRGMYYAGQLERRFPGVDLSMATAMENQTIPLGLSSLWKGSGAKYAWHGVCNCDTKMDPNSFGNRENEMYWYKGLDTNKILMKWYKMNNPSPFGNRELGGYAEIFSDSTGSLPSHTNMSIDDLAAKASITETGPYPYKIAAAFGVGWDAFITTKDELVAAAQAKTIPGPTGQEIIVSNEEDFFRDFETTYGSSLPIVTKTFGNEWDLNCASLSEISARMKRAIEKLRAAEAMAAIELNFDVTLMAPILQMRNEAWESIGLYWEHSMGFDNGTIAAREAFQRRLEADVTNYADALYNLAKKALGLRITNTGNSNTRFYAFNPLGWVRSDYVDFRFNVNNNIRVVDLTNNTEKPFQFITKDGQSYLRVQADSIPSVGYKVFEVVPGAGTVFPNAGTFISADAVECDSFRVEFTNAGVLKRVLDKRNNKELVQPGQFLNDLGSGNDNSGTSFVESNGPVSVTIFTQSSVPKSHITRVTLYKKIARIDIDNVITQNFDDATTWTYSFNNTATSEVWHEETGAVIKAKLTTNVTNPGHYAAQNARYDWNTLNHFASVNETQNGYGVTLSNQDCYFMQIGNSSVTTLDEASSQLKILAGGKVTSGSIGFVDQGGINEFNQRFSITTHLAYSAPAEMKKALEHQNFLVADTILSSGANFLLPNQFSLVSTNDPGTVIYAVKVAEEGIVDGIVTRAWNLASTDAVPTFTYGLAFNGAYRTTHVERDIQALTAASSNSIIVPLGQHEMKTFRVKTYPVALAINRLAFTGRRDINGNKNELRWNLEDESTILTYTIERSTDGNTFLPIKTLPKNSGNYTYADNTVNAAVSYYYRIKLLKTDGSFIYSHIVFLRADKNAANLLVYPNPAMDMVTVSLLLNKQQRCNVSVVNASGAIVKTTAPPLFERGYNTYSLSVKELPAGSYNIVITAGEKKYVQPFIKK